MIFALLVMAAACSKKEGDAPAKKGSDTGSSMAGSSMAGAGSSMAGSGTTMAAGSGSSMAGSGSDTGSAVAAGSGSAVAAGSGSATGSGSAAGSGAGSAIPDDHQMAFDKLSHDDKIKFMKTKVMPAMKTAFQEHDKEKFAKFNCKTCHGKGADKGGDFKMPNPDIAPLDFAALKAGKQKPKMAEFMGKVVTPQMAGIFEVPVHSEKDPNGFGCLECHTMKKQ